VSLSNSLVDNPKVHGALSDFALCIEAQQRSVSACVRIREALIVVLKGQ
jgi:hypothetical protein